MPYARIKPFNEATGHVLRNYTVGSKTFSQEKGWVEVDHETAEYLRDVVSDESDPKSPAAFDVAEDADQMEAIEEAERQASDPRITAASLRRQGAVRDRRGVQTVASGTRPPSKDHGTMTTADLPPNAKVAPLNTAQTTDPDDDDLLNEGEPGTPGAAGGPPAGRPAADPRVPGSPRKAR